MVPGETARSKGQGPDWKGYVMNILWSVLVTALSLVVMLWVATKLFDYVRSQWQPTREIAVGTFTALGGTLSNDAGAAAGPTLGSKLERLKRYARSDPSGFGLIKTPELISVPDQVRKRQSDASKRLEAMNLKVKDVQVNEVVKFLQGLFEPARPTLDGTITDYGDRIEVKAELIWKNQVLDGWVASRAKPDPEKAGQAGQVLNELYDDLLFQMIYDIPRNANLRWAVRSRGDDDIPNWQTLEAMTLGLESLVAYQRTLEYDDLKRSLHYLERIRIHAPSYALGHYFLGVAFGEDRQEQQAASTFAQIEGMKTTIELKWSARFQRAASMLEQYDGRAAQYAAEGLLTPLIQELKAAAEKNDASGKFARRLLPLAQAQLTYAYGTLFRLQASIPDAERIPEPELRRKAEQAWVAAKAAHDAAKDWSSDQERRDVLSWVQNAEGYARFRIAQWELEQSGKSEQERIKDFREASTLAGDLLWKASQERPNHYLALQNLAMILDDERYDPAGERLGDAESLYERTKRFVPRDYYQYERLARIYWRRARTQPVSTLQRELIKKGLESIKIAQDKRQPEKPTRTSAVCGAYFFIAAASGETDDTKKKEDVQGAIEQAKLVVQLRAQMGAERKPIAEDAARLMREVAKTLPDTDTNKKALIDLGGQLEG